MAAWFGLGAPQVFLSWIRRLLCERDRKKYGLRSGWVLGSESVACTDVVAQSLELPGGRWVRIVVFFGRGISVF